MNKKQLKMCDRQRESDVCSLHTHSENWHGLCCSFISLACTMTCSFLWLSWFVLIHSGILCHIPAPRFLPVCEYLWNNQGFLAFCDSYIIQRRATYIFCYKILLMKIYLFLLWKNHRIFVFNMSFVRIQHKQWESKNGFVLNKKWNDKRHYK